MIIKITLTYPKLARLANWLTSKGNLWATYFPTAEKPECDGPFSIKLVEIKSVEGGDKELNVTLTAPEGFMVKVLSDGRYVTHNNYNYGMPAKDILTMDLPPHLRRQSLSPDREKAEITLVDPTVFLSSMYAAINAD